MLENVIVSGGESNFKSEDGGQSRSLIRRFTGGRSRESCEIPLPCIVVSDTVRATVVKACRGVMDANLLLKRKMVIDFGARNKINSNGMIRLVHC